MRILQTLIAFSGNAPPQLAITAHLVERGHEVRVLAHEPARARIESTGAEFVPFRETLPGMDLSRPESDPVRDWEAHSSLGGAVRMRDRGMIEPLLPCAREVAELFDDWNADVVVFDFLLLGAPIAAERAGIPAVALVHCPYPLPAKGAPPLGSGLRPARGPFEHAREAIARRLTDRFYGPLLEAINDTRAQLGLAELKHWSDQLLGSNAIFVLTAPELDFASRAKLPGNVHYAGPAFEHYTDDWESPWPAGNGDPLVLISFSSSYMDQRGLAERVLGAVSELPVRALLTTGPALELDGIEIPDNVRVAAFVPHLAVLPHAALVVTHAGWGTVSAALSAGVPLVCIPDGRDQPDNAARVVEAGAGIRLGKTSTREELRDAIESALADPSLAQGAGRMAEALGRRDGANTVAEALESLSRRPTPG